MATDTTDVDVFGQVSRVRGVAFEYLSLAASVFGILALAVLLVYVTIDAFDLTSASPSWLLTYFVTLVGPYLAFCLYSAADRELTQRVLGVLGGADRVGVALVGAEALDGVEVELGPGGDHQVVVVDLLAVGQVQGALVRLDPLHRLGDEVDPPLLHVGADRHGDVLARAPAHRQPGVGGDEVVLLGGVDQGDVVLLTEGRPHLVAGGEAAEAGA